MSGLHRICFTIRHWSAKIHADLIPHGPSGRSVIRSGSRCVCGMLDWQAMQVDTNLSHCESIPGNHTCALKSCFVRTWPWWPSCAISTIVCLSFAGKTIRSPLKTIPSTMVSSWKTCRNSFVLVSFVSSLYLGCPLTSGNFPHNSLPNWAWSGWLQLSHAQLLCMPWFPRFTSSLTGLPSKEAIRAVFFIVCLNLSTSPLTSTHPGVTFRYLNPSFVLRIYGCWSVVRYLIWY